MIHIMKLTIRLDGIATLALLLAFAGATMGQSKQNLPDGVQLGMRFTEAFGQDFDLVKSEFKTRSNERGGGTFWLAYVQAKRAGHFYLQYRYKYSDPHYSHVERELRFSVGPKACRRGPPHAGTYGRFCLGDTIILPVMINRFTEHEFKLVKAEYAGDKEEPTFDDRYPESRDQGLNKADVANPVAESLRYVGRNSHKMLHRNSGYTLELYAVFEAVKPGRFNLVVSLSPQGRRSPNAPPPGVPIIVVARDTPMTMIAGSEEVRGFTMGYDGREYVSSSSGNSYMTNLIILQPGARISLKYFSKVRRPEWEKGRVAGLDASDPLDDAKPVITVYPFAIDAKYDFGEWLLAYLPR